MSRACGCPHICPPPSSYCQVRTELSQWSPEGSIGKCSAPAAVPVVAVKDSCGVYIVSHRQLFVVIDLVSKGQAGSSRDAIRRYGSATLDERLEDPAAVGVKRAGKARRARLSKADWSGPRREHRIP